jgi:hypothetical protein
VILLHRLWLPKIISGYVTIQAIGYNGPIVWWNTFTSPPSRVKRYMLTILSMLIKYVTPAPNAK